MKFDNKGLESGAQQSLSILQKLKNALNFSGSSKGLNDLQNSANRFSLAGISNGIDGVTRKFSALAAVAFSVINNITNRAVDAGLKLAKSLTIDPIKTGFAEYEQTLDATQTIMSGTGESVEKVTATLAELNKYADTTIYSFSDMTKNMKHFTNAGLSSEKAARVMIGVSNAAASAGVNAEAAGRAMFGFGQSMSMGFVGLEDWNQIDNAGIATKEFKNELIQAGLAVGTLKKGSDGIIRTNKGTEVSFKNLRTTLKDQWLSSEALVKTLDKYSDKSTEVGKKAAENAQRVKNLTQLMGILQESSQSGWSTTFLHLFGDLKEATNLWTGVNKVVGGFIDRSNTARNNMLKVWKDGGGRKELLKGLEEIFNFAVSIAKPIGEAFRQIFPPTTGKQLIELTHRFREFTSTLKIGAGTADKIKRTFAGVFAVFSIGWQVVKGILRVFGELFGFLSQNSGGFLEFTAGIGDFLVSLDQAMKKGDLVNVFLDGLASAISKPLEKIKALGSAIAKIFAGWDESTAKSVSDFFNGIGQRLAPLSKIGGLVAKGWDALIKATMKVVEFIRPAVELIGSALSGLWSKIKESLGGADFNSIMDLLNTVLLGGILLAVKKFFSNGLNIDFGGGFVEGIKDTFGALTDTMKAMQTQVQAKTLMTIAIAIGLLTASIVVLSMIDPKALTKALVGIGVAFGELMVAMVILTKMTGLAGFAKIPVLATSMIILAAAMLVMSFAVRNMASLKWEELVKGLGAVGVILAMIAGFTAVIGKSPLSIKRTASAMIIFAVAINILAAAVKKMGELSLADLAKGLGGVAISMGLMVKAMSAMPKTMVAQAAGLLLVGVALNAVGIALKLMGTMKWGEIAKSLVLLAGSLAILAGGLYLMTASLPGAAALVVAAAGLMILAPVLKIMGGLSWKEIGHGLVALGGSLVVLALGLTLMIAALPGAAALTIAASGLAVMVPVLAALGVLPWGVILKSLVALSATFAVLAVGGLLLAPVIPILMGLSVAILLVGAGFVLVGAGALALASAFSVFAAAGAAGLAVLSGMAALIPVFMANFAEGIIAFATTIASNSAKFVSAFKSLLIALLDAVIRVAPKIREAINVLIASLLNIIVTNAPKIASAALKLITALLTTLKNNVGKIVPIAVDLITRFMNALGNQLPKLQAAGARLIIKFINGLANTIRANSKAMGNAGGNLASAMVEGMVSGLFAGVGRIIRAAKSVALSAFNAAKSALESNSPSKKFIRLGNDGGEGLAIGFEDSEGRVSDAASGMANTALSSVTKSMSGLSDILNGTFDTRPVITPVLDLTQFQKDAGGLGAAFGRPVVAPSALIDSALAIENSRINARLSTIDTRDNSPAVSYVQNNYSPEALSATEIYRNTRSQLAQAKGGFDIK